MIIAEGDVLIYNTPYVVGGFVKNNFKVTMLLFDKGYITQINPIEKEAIKKGVRSKAEFKILDGELILEKLLDSPDFKLISSKEIGEGRITNVKEIILEADTGILGTMDQNDYIKKIADKNRIIFKA